MKKEIEVNKDGSEIGGSRESTSPCTQVKHLANLLRNKANSQQYPSMYEDRPKSIEDTGKQMVRGLLQDKKVPGTSRETRATAAPGPAPSGSATGLLGESRVNSSLPCQTRLEQH